MRNVIDNYEHTHVSLYMPFTDTNDYANQLHFADRFQILFNCLMK
jgi:hypothetical protein